MTDLQTVLPQCIYRDWVDPCRIRCTHAKVFSHEETLPACVCCGCSNLTSKAPINSEAASSIYTTSPLGRESWIWCVGVITAPRRQPTLEVSIQSLSDAGWTEPIVFAEPKVKCPRVVPSTRWVQRTTRLGAFSNWYLALTELVLRTPEADFYLICEDDVVYSAKLRKFLEKHYWPDHTGTISLFRSSGESGLCEGGFQEVSSPLDRLGALAYVFPNESARILISDYGVLRHRFSGPNSGLMDTDVVVSDWCNASGRQFIQHVPSLVQHIGDTSTLYPGASCRGRRCADATAFSGENAKRGTESGGRSGGIAAR
jgi:hypothetical protein